MRKITSLLMLFCVFAATAWAQTQDFIYKKVSHENWTVTAPNQSGQDGNEGGVAFIADDNPATFYHSDWGGSQPGGNGLQGFLIELPEAVEDIAKITYAGRSDNRSSGWASKVRIYVYSALPEGWPEKALGELTHEEKENLFKKGDNTVLGTPTFENSSEGWNKEDLKTKSAEFDEVDGKYILFIMDEGKDKWLTCSDFQIYTKKYGEAAKITYEFYYNDVKKDEFTHTATTLVGEDYPDFDVKIPDYISATKPEGKVESSSLEDGAATVRVDLKDDLPFTASSDYANAVWYTMKIRGNEYVAMTETAPYANVKSLPLNDGAFWAFSGNAFDGITVYNKMAGSEKTLGYDAKTTNSNVYMKEGTTTWNIKSGNGGFVLYQEATECIHDLEDKLQFWVANGAPTDPGSAFTVEPESDLVADWKELTKSAFGFVGGYPASMETEVDEVSSLSGIISFETENASNKIELEVGAYYRFKNIMRKKMLGANGTNRVPVEEGNDDVSQIWVFEAGSADGKYVIKNLNANKYMKNTDANDLVAEGGADYTLSALGYGQFNLVSGSNLVIYGGGGLGGWHENPLNSDGAWYIMPATDIDVVIGEAGYATTYLPFDVTLPETLTAYAVTETQTDKAFFTEKEDIPAGNAAILAGAKGKHKLTIGEASSNWEGNLLSGSLVDTNITPAANTSYYVLSMPADSPVGLYKAQLNVSTDKTNDGTTEAPNVTYEAILSNANKAYLPVTGAAAAAPFFRFDFGTETAIESIQGVESANAVVYDLAGRRVQGAQKGLYIVNGKKVIK